MQMDDVSCAPAIWSRHFRDAMNPFIVEFVGHTISISFYLICMHMYTAAAASVVCLCANEQHTRTEIDEVENIT